MSPDGRPCHRRIIRGNLSPHGTEENCGYPIRRRLRRWSRRCRSLDRSGAPQSCPVGQCDHDGYLLGDRYRIVEEEQHGATRAGYGEELIERLAADLSARFRRGVCAAFVSTREPANGGRRARPPAPAHDHPGRHRAGRGSPACGGFGSNRQSRPRVSQARVQRGDCRRPSQRSTPCGASVSSPKVRSRCATSPMTKRLGCGRRSARSTGPWSRSPCTPASVAPTSSASGRT